MRESYRNILIEDDGEEWKYVKAADKLAAYIKCIQERNTGNTDFSKAEASTKKVLDEMQMEEVEIFIRDFLPSYTKTIDEISK